MNVLVKFPSRGRPERCAQVLREMHERQTDAVTYLLSLDTDDPKLPQYTNTIEGMDVNTVVGHSTDKVSAINRDVNECGIEWDVLVVASDDMWPVVDGWDEVIRGDMSEHFPDLDGMLWYSDGHTHDKLYTMPIMGRRYYRRFGYVYNPAYRSFFCDDEMMAIAKAHDKVKYIDRVLFEHRHPDNRVKGVESDPTYRRAIPHWQQDEATFKRRRREGFPQ